MNDLWSIGLRKVKNYSLIHSKTPLIILPSSFLFKKTNFPALFSGRTAPAYIFSRERYSLEILQSLPFNETIRLGLDHDMALCLADSDFIRKNENLSQERHLLIVERRDPESSTISRSGEQSDRTEKGLLKSIKKNIPKSAKQSVNNQFLWPLKRVVNHSSIGKLDLKSEFAKEQLERLHISDPTLSDLPIFYADISLASVCSFSRFVRLIAHSKVVVSTRLHVALLASMLGKNTYLKTGNYHKIKGIYEYSLTDKNNVYLIDDVPVNS